MYAANLFSVQFRVQIWVQVFACIVKYRDRDDLSFESCIEYVYRGPRSTHVFKTCEIHEIHARYKGKNKMEEGRVTIQAEKRAIHDDTQFWGETDPTFGGNPPPIRPGGLPACVLLAFDEEDDDSPCLTPLIEIFQVHPEHLPKPALLLSGQTLAALALRLRDRGASRSRLVDS